MPNYGFIMSQLRIHPHGRRDAPHRLGTLAPPDQVSTTRGNEGLKIFYGVLRGLIDVRLGDSTGTKHVKIKSVTGVGQCVRFSYEIGSSGQNSLITDPNAAPDVHAFRRETHHIETADELRRGLLIMPDNSVTGMLVLEAQGRTTMAALLREELKRSFRQATEGRSLILDVEPYADPVALARYLEDASINAINLRRSTIPSDLAASLEMDQGEDNRGALKVQVTGSFRRSLLDKLRGDQAARRQLLVMEGIAFEELNVSVRSSHRNITISVVGDRAPSFINVIGPSRPGDNRFYREVVDMVTEVAEGAGVRLDVSGWDQQEWSNEAKAFTIERPESAGAGGQVEQQVLDS